MLLLPVFALLQETASVSKSLNPISLIKTLWKSNKKDTNNVWMGEIFFSDTSKTLLWKEVRESYYLPDLLSPVQFLMASQVMLFAFKP